MSSPLPENYPDDDEILWDQLQSWADREPCPVCGHQGLTVTSRLAAVAGTRTRSIPGLRCPGKGCMFGATSDL